ncbi:MAG: hypothetical protein ACXWUL_02065 [Caldimonas sp.]
MGKFRIRAWLDQAIFVVLIMAGATMTAVLDVRAIAGAIASKHGLGNGVAATAPLPPKPPVAAASGARSGLPGTVVARLAH